MSTDRSACRGPAPANTTRPPPKDVALGQVDARDAHQAAVLHRILDTEDAREIPGLLVWVVAEAETERTVQRETRYSASVSR